MATRKSICLFERYYNYMHFCLRGHLQTMWTARGEEGGSKISKNDPRYTINWSMLGGGVKKAPKMIHMVWRWPLSFNIPNINHNLSPATTSYFQWNMLYLESKLKFPRNFFDRFFHHLAFASIIFSQLDYVIHNIQCHRFNKWRKKYMTINLR